MSTNELTTTDRGYVIVERQSDGLNDVYICGSPPDGIPPTPSSSFAVYRHWTKADVRGVRLERSGRFVWTTEVVEVTAELDTESVVIRAVTTL